VHLVLPTLATAIAGYVVALLAKQLQRAGIQLTDAQDERLRAIVRDAIRYAEEQARRNPLTGSEKRAIAVNQSVARVPSISVDTAERVVDQQLPVVRAELAPKPSTPATFGRTN